MVEKQHKPLGYVQNLYAKYTSEYNNIIDDSPHQQLEKEQKMIFGFGGESIGLLMMYFSVVNIMSFTFVTLIGVIGLVCSIAIMKYSSKLINSAAA